MNLHIAKSTCNLLYLVLILYIIGQIKGRYTGLTATYHWTAACCILYGFVGRGNVGGTLEKKKVHFDEKLR